jgi:hypothetical protein
MHARTIQHMRDTCHTACGVHVPYNVRHMISVRHSQKCEARPRGSQHVQRTNPPSSGAHKSRSGLPRRYCLVPSCDVNFSSASLHGQRPHGSHRRHGAADGALCDITAPMDRSNGSQERTCVRRYRCVYLSLCGGASVRLRHASGEESYRSARRSSVMLYFFLIFPHRARPHG